MLWLAGILFIILMVAVMRVESLDVETGLREGDDGYGSNRGWYWPWTPIIQICVIGIFCCLFSAPFIGL